VQSLSRAARLCACEAAVGATSDAVQIHGDCGSMRDYGMEKLMRDAQCCHCYPRAAQEELLDLVAEAELGQRRGPNSG